MSLAVFPLAITMNAGPQIMSAIIFVTASKPLKLSAYFMAGVVIAVTVGVTITLHPRQRAGRQHLARRPLRFRIYRQHHPVRAGRIARYPVHQELPDPRDERTAALARRHAERDAKDGVPGRAAAALDLPF